MALKIRVIPILLHDGGRLVKSVRFDPWRSLGPPIQAVRVHEARQVDELIFLDIHAEVPDFDLIWDVTEELYCPVTIGGGVRTIENIRTILALGADKISINTARPSLIASASRKFGSQAIVASIDYRDGCNAILEAQQAETDGAGEILLQSVDRDGMMEGYDLSLIKAVSAAVGCPVVACSGAGTPEHCAEALRAGASAVAVGAMFQFTDTTPNDVKAHLKSQGYPVRYA